MPVSGPEHRSFGSGTGLGVKMPPPTSYTEDSLADYITYQLGDIGTALEWDASHIQVYQAVYDTYRALGITTEADLTAYDSVESVERLATVAGWRRAVNSLAAAYDLQTVGEALDRSQLFDHAKIRLNEAERLAVSAGDLTATAGVAILSRVIHSGDPYAYSDTESYIP